MKNKIEQLTHLLSSKEYKDVLQKQDYITDEPMTPQNYLTQLHRKLQQLKIINNEEQIKLQESLLNQDKLKQTLAECIRQSHVQQNHTKQEINDKQKMKILGVTSREQIKLATSIKQQEFKSLNYAISNLEEELMMADQDYSVNKSDLAQLGSELNDLQLQAQQSKEEHTNIIQELQQSNVSSNHLVQTLNQQKIIYQALVQKNKSSQQKQIDYEAQAFILEAEQKKLEQDTLKLRPKLEQKVEKLKDLDQLKSRIADQLIIKTDELGDNRKSLQKLEEDLNSLPSFEKPIQQERKAQQALDIERKLLMNEFQRISNQTGIEQIQRDSKIYPQNEATREETSNSQQNLIQTQTGQITFLESELQYISEEHQKLVIRRVTVLKEYAQLENSMDTLGLKFSRLNETINQQIQI